MFLYFINIINAKATASNSATGVASHIPVTPNTNGKTNRQITINTKEREKARIAETIPLFSAVNIPLEKILNPIDFEYIRMLKELNMSIEEIGTYRETPTPAGFLKIADAKEKELEKEIQKLKNIKTILKKKKEQIVFCEAMQEQEIRIEECKAERILVYPYDFSEGDISEIFYHMKDMWGIEQIRMGIGSFIKEKGKYLCGYQKGTWDKLPDMYQKMLAYAEKII